VAVRTSLVLLATAGVAHADVTDGEIIGERGWGLEDIQLRTTYVDQNGRGFQSQDGPLPGSEQMRVLQWSTLVTLRQSERVVHSIALPFDAITAASPDAVDATTSASKHNIAGDLDIRSTWTLSEDSALTTRFIVHAEEWLGGGTLGAGYRRSLADDNATISINGSFGYDVFDDHDRFGSYLGKTGRATTNLSLAGSQLLSPTTVLDGSYGVTYQDGTLETGWNSVPLANGDLTEEELPTGRVRHAFTAGVAQHVPRTRSTVKARYRFYVDDFGLQAHTIKATVYQYISGWLYVSGAYRFHDQSGVDFFTTSLAMPVDPLAFRTADSDLADMSAHELTFAVTTLRGRGPLGKWFGSAEVMHYDRTNDLRIVALSLSVGRAL
jgi:hypothetical protein